MKSQGQGQSKMRIDLWLIRNKRNAIKTIDEFINNKEERNRFNLNLGWLIKYRHKLLKQILEIQLENFDKSV